MQAGKFNIDMVDTGIFGLDGGSMFGVVPKALWARAYDKGDEMNRIPLSARPMLIRWDDRIMLVDTGNGNKMNDKLAKIYKIDREKGAIDRALNPFGLKPEDITDVILTHLHFDHVGGATVIKDGEAVPAFPNARFYVQKDQLEWAKSPTEKDRASYMPDDFMPIIESGRLEAIDGAEDIYPGIRVEPVFGHTKAMQVVKIDDDDAKLMYCADVCPTAAHIHIPFVMGYDNNPLTTIQEKKRYLPEAASDGRILVFEHDAFMQAARIRAGKKGFEISEKVQLTDTAVYE
jgi:glyoxylase-like metal-dependent hydrolase (beta-lactamase superfamily II)